MIGRDLCTRGKNWLRFAKKNFDTTPHPRSWVLHQRKNGCGYEDLPLPFFDPWKNWIVRTTQMHQYHQMGRWWMLFVAWQTRSRFQHHALRRLPLKQKIIALTLILIHLRKYSHRCDDASLRVTVRPLSPNNRPINDLSSLALYV